MDLVEILWRLGVVLLLILINGFFVAAEFALVSVRPTRLDELATRGNRSARLARKAQDDPSHFISAAQLGITVASLLWLDWRGDDGGNPARPAGGVAARGGRIYRRAHGGHAAGAGADHPAARDAGRAGAEDDRAADGRGDDPVLHPPGGAVAGLFRPFIWLLSVSTNVVLRALNLRYQSEEQAVHSPEELQLLIRHSAQAGEILAGEREMLDRVFGFADLTAGDVMIPRTEVAGIPAEASVDESLAIALRHRHSRFPVYEGSLDNVVGVLLAKDLLALSNQPRGPASACSG